MATGLEFEWHPDPKPPWPQPRDFTCSVLPVAYQTCAGICNEDSGSASHVWQLTAFRAPPSSFLLSAPRLSKPVWKPVPSCSCCQWGGSPMPTLPPNHTHRSHPAPLQHFQPSLGDSTVFPRKPRCESSLFQFSGRSTVNMQIHSGVGGWCSYAPWDNCETISNVSTVPCHRKPEPSMRALIRKRTLWNSWLHLLHKELYLLPCLIFVNIPGKGGVSVFFLTPSLCLFFPKKLPTQGSQNWLPDWYSHKTEFYWVGDGGEGE